MAKHLVKLGRPSSESMFSISHVPSLMNLRAGNCHTALGSTPSLQRSSCWRDGWRMALTNWGHCGYPIEYKSQRPCLICKLRIELSFFRNAMTKEVSGHGLSNVTARWRTYVARWGEVLKIFCKVENTGRGLSWDGETTRILSLLNSFLWDGSSNAKHDIDRARRVRVSVSRSRWLMNSEITSNDRVLYGNHRGLSSLWRLKMKDV